MKTKIKQLKDREDTEAIIKISKVKEIFKTGEGSYSSKDKLICIQIDKPTVRTSTCFPCTFKGKRELIKLIKKELYIK